MSGQDIAAPPSSVMNSRRLTRLPRRRGQAAWTAPRAPDSAGRADRLAAALRSHRGVVLRGGHRAVERARPLRDLRARRDAARSRHAHGAG